MKLGFLYPLSYLLFDYQFELKPLMISSFLVLNLSECHFFSFRVSLIPVSLTLFPFTFSSMYRFTISLWLSFCSIAITSNCSHESNVCIITFLLRTLCILGYFIDLLRSTHPSKMIWFVKFLHCFPIAAQFFKCPSTNGLPHLLHCFRSSALYLFGALLSSCFRRFLLR